VAKEAAVTGTCPTVKYHSVNKASKGQGHDLKAKAKAIRGKRPIIKPKTITQK